MKRPWSPGKLLAQTVAAVAIAVFWCIARWELLSELPSA